MGFLNVTKDKPMKFNVSGNTCVVSYNKVKDKYDVNYLGHVIAEIDNDNIELFERFLQDILMCIPYGVTNGSIKL